MRNLCIVAVVLAGCAANPVSQPASFTTHLDGSYTAVGGAVFRR